MTCLIWSLTASQFYLLKPFPYLPKLQSNWPSFNYLKNELFHALISHVLKSKTNLSLRMFSDKTYKLRNGIVRHLFSPLKLFNCPLFHLVITLGLKEAQNELLGNYLLLLTGAQWFFFFSSISRNTIPNSSPSTLSRSQQTVLPCTLFFSPN